MLMYWPGHASSVDIPEATQTFYLDSNSVTNSRAGMYPLDVPIAFVFRPDKDGVNKNGWKWWRNYFSGMQGLPDARDPAKPQLRIKKIYVDMEWDTFFLANDIFGMKPELNHDIVEREIVPHFRLCRTMLKDIFGNVPIHFYGDNSPVPEVAPNGKVTGSHLFWSWQHIRQQESFGQDGFINQFWHLPDAYPIDQVQSWGRCITHWVNKIWDPATQKIVNYSDLDLQYKYGCFFGRQNSDICLYYCEPSKALEEFRRGWRDAAKQSWEPGVRTSPLWEGLSEAV